MRIQNTQLTHNFVNVHNITRCDINIIFNILCLFWFIGPSYIGFFSCATLNKIKIITIYCLIKTTILKRTGIIVIENICCHKLLIFVL